LPFDGAYGLLWHDWHPGVFPFAMPLRWSMALPPSATFGDTKAGFLRSLPLAMCRRCYGIYQ